MLYQEEHDPQLFTALPAPQTTEDRKARLRARLGEVPPEPVNTGFVGRSRELLALERLLRQERWAVLRGQGGEGKTALAAELARWLVRSQPPVSAKKSARYDPSTWGPNRRPCNRPMTPLCGKPSACG